MSVAETLAVVAVATMTAYYAVYHLGYLFVVASAARRMAADLAWPADFERVEIFANPLTPTVSVLVPAHNEQAGIVDAVASLRNLRYPDVEIVVVDDGSTDGTFAALEDAYALAPADLPVRETSIPQQGETTASYRSADGTVLVIRKRSVGRRGDAVNAALRVARGELICMIDADSMLAPESLLRLAAPFIDDPRVVAAGGSVLPSNGIAFENGQVRRFGLPRRWIERFQAIEYLRAFLIGRSGWAQRNALVIISGAFGLYRKEALVRVGGLQPDSLAEDADLLLAVHADAVHREDSYRVVFLAEPICWTEVPSRARVLARQRTRWAQGLDEILGRYRSMIGNRRFGALGMLSLPWTFLFEYLAPVVAVVATVITALALALGWIPLALAALVAAAGIGLSALVTIVALMIEAVLFRRYASPARVGLLLLLALLEPFFYRPALIVWQLRGIARARRGHPGEWGRMERSGTRRA